MITAESVGVSVDAVIPQSSGPLPGESGITPQTSFTGEPAGLELEQTPAPSGAQDEYQFVLPTGEKFRTADDLANAKAAATQKIQTQNEIIQSLLSKITAPAAPANQSVAAADPAKQFIENKIRRLTAKGFDVEAARIIAEEQWEDRREIDEQLQNNTEKARYDAFVSANPVLLSDVGQQVWNNYQRTNGRTFSSPQDHLNAVIAHCAMNGIEIPSQYRSRNAAASAPANNGAVDERINLGRQALRQPHGGTGAPANGSANGVSGDPSREQNVKAAFGVWQESLGRTSPPEQQLKIYNTMRKAAGLPPVQAAR